MNKGLICLLLNLINPGYGTLIAGDKSNGFWQIGLWWGGVVLFAAGWVLATPTMFISLILSLLALVPMGIGWVWALMDGLKYKDSLTGNLTKGNIALILNFYIPGIGTIVYGDKDTGMWQFILHSFGWIVGIGATIGLVWSIIDGIKLNDTLTEEI